MQKVSFYNADTKFRLRNKKKLKNFFPYILEQENSKLERLAYIFCSDEYLLNMNKKFLQHNFYTDILTFETSTSQYIKAEIYISVDRIKDNSKFFGVSFKTEMLRVLIHGVLHLCGYNDHNNSQKSLMRKKEDFYINRFT